MPNETDIQQKCVNVSENLHATYSLSISILERGSQDQPLFPGLLMEANLDIFKFALSIFLPVWLKASFIA